MAKPHFLPCTSLQTVGLLLILCIIGLVALVSFFQVGAAAHRPISETIIVLLTALVPSSAVIWMNIDEHRRHRRALERRRQREIKQKYR